MATKMKPTFEVDKQGMAMVFARKGKAFVVTELIQNAWDEDTTHVDVTLEQMGKGKVRIVVEDDNPEGFADLAHAYTLFAESAKKSDPTKRGRFNLGEKLVIAICESATIETTKGQIVFTKDGRQHLAKKRKAGSRFTGVIPMTEAEVTEVEEAIFALIPPPGIDTTYNMKQVPVRQVYREFPVTLRTERSDADGRLTATTRKTTVQVFDPMESETPMLYEMGIPVVELNDRFHVNIGQKVPLNTDRDNVPPGFLRDVRVAVLNACHDLLTDTDMEASWVVNAMESDKVDPAAVEAAIKGKFGDKVVIRDMNDPEANKIAAEQGYTVVPGGALPKAAWAQVKAHKVMAPAGQVTPSPNPEEGAEDLKVMPPEHWPLPVAQVVEFSRVFAERLLDAKIEVRVVNDPTWPFAATYGPRKAGKSGQLTLNLGTLGYKWFEGRAGGRQSIIDLLIHEFGHHYCSDHLDRGYLNALTQLGAKAVELALTDPDLYDIDAHLEATLDDGLVA